MTMSVCLSVGLPASTSLGPHVQSLPIFFGGGGDTYGRRSAIFWRRCDTLCTSGFIDAVASSHNGSQWRHIMFKRQPVVYIQLLSRLK